MPRLIVTSALLADTAAAPAFADDKPPAQSQPQPPPKLTTTKLTDHLFIIEGGGGNVAVFTWDEGALLVDDKLAPLTPLLKEQLAGITSKPVRFVLNTHWHGDHVGGNEAMAAGGAVILAHENVRKRMSVESFVELMNRKVPPSPEKALPVVTFTRDVTLHLGGEDIEVVHVDPAHTDGDSLVHFVVNNAVHMGDTYMTISYPFVDVSNGGRFEGFIGAADRGMLLANTATKIIPGHGDVTSREDLKTWRDMLVTIRDRVKKDVARKKTLKQIQEAKHSAAWDAKLGQAFITPDKLIEFVYLSVTKK
jgi:glyoxylase-like metal-dependent hydrolase (beta-lactamase superfamily II)